MKGLCTLLLLLPLVLGGAAPAAADMWDITPQTAYDWLNPGNGAYNPNAILLDVRRPDEWLNPGHPGYNGVDGAFLEGYVINLPVKLYNNNVPPTMVLNDLFDDEALSRFQLTDYLLVMCRSGVRSLTAKQILDGAGFTNVYNVLDGFGWLGGTTGWMNSNLPYNTSSEGMWVSYSPAPAPATILLLGSGLLALGVGRGFWRR